jgi:hypothetical protein
VGESEKRNVLHPQVGEQSFNHLLFLCVQIAGGLPFQHPEDVDPVPSHFSKSTPLSPVTGCGIMPNAAAAFEAKDINKLMKLAGSSSGSWPVGRVSSRGGRDVVVPARPRVVAPQAGAFLAAAEFSIRASVAAALDSACLLGLFLFRRQFARAFRRD